MELVFFSLFIAVCVAGTPSDVNGLLGAALVGFVLGCFILGEDGQLHSKIFFWFAVLGALLMICLTNYGVIKNMNKVSTPVDFKTKDKIMNQ